jgi:hypothetical protein
VRVGGGKIDFFPQHNYITQTKHRASFKKNTELLTGPVGTTDSVLPGCRLPRYTCFCALIGVDADILLTRQLYTDTLYHSPRASVFCFAEKHCWPRVESTAG